MCSSDNIIKFIIDSGCSNYCEKLLPTLKVVRKGFRDDNLYAINIDVSQRNDQWVTPHVAHDQSGRSNDANT